MMGEVRRLRDDVMRGRAAAVTQGRSAWIVADAGMDRLKIRTYIQLSVLTRS